MIIVKGRELLIPENERYIGTTYDDNSTVRTFRIPRFHEDGMDKSQLDFYVIINYDDGSDPDAVGVTKSVSDDYIVLEWDVGEDITEHSGCLYLWVRGFDHTGTSRWSSFPGVFYIETSGTEPSDLSDLEERISEEDKLIRLAKLYKSQPMTAATAAEMIDREQIYVYVGDEAGYTYGNWYFWDGDAWVPGGVYNSIAIQTDKELIAPDVAADAKAVGDELTDLKKELKDEAVLYRDLFFPKTVSGQDPEGFCGVLKSGEDSAILFDLGLTDNYQAIKSAMAANGVTKIIAVVISHYHSDHIGDAALFAEDFDCSDMTLFLPLITSNHAMSDLNLQERRDHLISSFSGADVVYPTEGQVETVGDYTLTFHNCGANAVAHWDDLNTTDYNSYSMVTYASYGSTTVFLTADMTIDTQGYLFDNGWYKEAIVVTAPHHSHNYQGNSGLILETGSKYIYAADSKGITKSIGYQDNFSQAFGIFGGLMYRNTSNDSDIHFYLGKNGVLTPAYAQPCDLYGYSGVLTFTVDSTYTGNKSTGSTDHPFTSLRAALEMCKIGTGRYEINVIHMDAESVYINGVRNVTINVPNETEFALLSFERCDNVFIIPVNTNWSVTGTTEIYHSTNIQLRNGTLNKVSSINYSKVYFRDCKFNSALNANYVLASWRSDLVFINCSCDLTRTGFVAAEYSEIKMTYAFTCFPNISHLFEEVNRSHACMGTDFSNETSALKAYGLCPQSSYIVTISGNQYVLHNGEFTKILKNQRVNWATTMSVKGEDMLICVGRSNLFSISKIGGSYSVSTLAGSNTGVTFSYDTTNNIVTVTISSANRMWAEVFA